MVELGKNALDKIPLDPDLRAAIELAQRIKKEGRRRQLQLIGKMLRQRDVEPIRQALDKLKNRHNQQVALFHKLEQIRDRLIDNGDDAIAEVLNLWPDADRQQLRTLVRNARKEKEGNKPPKSARLIFQYLRELAEAEVKNRVIFPLFPTGRGGECSLSHSGRGKRLHCRFCFLCQPIQQLLMDPTKPAVAHHQNVIARLRGFHHHLR
ncbi:x96 protein [Leclercia adecarboxylata]|uniref:X96 protein n=1 Tax=Leclercia adecarboxylata TaxID=83655 RepID=A0A4U9HIT8_9ENTR|nr:x96 protein [Leclercia adecarboxylata]